MTLRSILRSQPLLATLWRSLNILEAPDRRRFKLVAILQVGLGFLDLVGVAAIGILGALAVTGIQSEQPGNSISAVLNAMHLTSFSFQTQVAILGISSATILIVRTIFSIVVTRRIYFFLSRRGSLLSSKLISKLLSQSLIQLQSRSSQETLFLVTSGVNAITLGVLATAITLVADGSLLFIMTIGLFVVDPVIALTAVIFFGSLGVALYQVMNVKAQKLSYAFSELNIKSNEKILEVFESYRESVVGNRRNYYAREIGKLRFRLANVMAELQFMPNVSKYVIESGVVIGAVLVAGVQFALLDAKQAVATLSIFLASGTRIAPAVMRLQQNLIQIKSGIGSAMPTLALIESLEGIKEDVDVIDTVDFIHDKFLPKIKVESISLMYTNSKRAAIDGVSFEVVAGDSLAIVGPSGAGKTSILDVILGVVPPTSGNILISDNSPLMAISKWPGAIAYVPQEVKLLNGNFRENVARGYPKDLVTDSLVWEALELAQLKNFVESLEQGLDAPVGENGAKISGGQRQRLGIARALFTKPKLLVLDEATSSLDGQTESDISDAIAKLRGSVTIVMIAHRLSTVRNSDQVIYMDKGKIIAKGKFEEVRKAVPDFDHQAQLMGL